MDGSTCSSHHTRTLFYYLKTTKMGLASSHSLYCNFDFLCVTVIDKFQPQPRASHTPSVTNGTFEGSEAYMTSDLFIKHPTIPDLYRVHGRTDDQIMLSTGEKVMCCVLMCGLTCALMERLTIDQPSSLGSVRMFGIVDIVADIHCIIRREEHIISRCPLVNNVLMFGRGKFQNGVLIEPTEPFDPVNSEKLSKFRNAIW